MTDRNRIFAKLLVFVAAFALAACAAKPPEDVQIKGSIEAVASVNPDSLGRPSPLQFEAGIETTVNSCDFKAQAKRAFGFDRCRRIHGRRPTCIRIQGLAVI